MLKSDLRKFACLLGVLSSTFYSQALWANETPQEHDTIDAEIGATLDENKIENDSDNNQLSNEQVDGIQNAYRFMWKDQSKEMPLTKDNVKELYHEMINFRDSKAATKSDKAEINKYLPLIESSAKKMSVDLETPYTPYTSSPISTKNDGRIKIVKSEDSKSGSTPSANQSTEASSAKTDVTDHEYSQTDKNSTALVEYTAPQNPAFLKETPWQHVTKDGKVITIGEDGKYIIADPKPQTTSENKTIPMPSKDMHYLSSKYLSNQSYELTSTGLGKITQEIAPTYAKANADEKRILRHDAELLTKIAESAQSAPLRIEVYSLNHYITSVDNIVKMSNNKPAVLTQQYINNLEVNLSTTNAYLNRVLQGTSSSANNKVFSNAELYYQIAAEKNITPQQLVTLQSIVNQARQFNSNFPPIIDIPKLSRTTATPNIKSTRTTTTIRQHKTNETIARRNATSSSSAGIKSTQRSINIIDFSRSSSALNE